MHRQFWIILVIALGVSLIPLFLFINRQTLQLLLNIPPLILLVMVTLMLISWIFEGTRLRMLCSLLHIGLPLHSSMGIVMAAEFAGAATPAASGMGAAYILFLRRRGVDIGHSGGLLVLIIIFDLLFIILLFSGAILIMVSASRHVPNLSAFVTLLITVLSTFIIAILAWHIEHRRLLLWIDYLLRQVRWYRRHRFSVARSVHRFAQAAGLIKTMNWRHRWLIFGSTAGYWLPRYLILWILMAYAGVIVSVPYLIVSQTLLNLTVQLSILPGGAGTVGAAYALLFGSTMARGDVGFSLLGWRFFTYYWYLLVGAPWFFLELKSGFQG
jgi:uncharacterized protein (TIRG00374 family)